MAARYRRLGLAALALIACTAAAPQAVVLPPVGRYIRPQTVVRLPDGRRFNMVCKGKGTPVAIGLPGLSEWSMGWYGLHEELARTTRTCLVDRAGYGFSDAGPMPRDAAANVSDLYQALKASHLPGPFVLVGHSLGGLELRLFAYRHPDMVSGLLLIDPTIEHSAAGLQQSKEELDAPLAFYRACLAMARARPLAVGDTAPGQAEPCVPPPHQQRTAEEKRLMPPIFARTSRFETWISQWQNLSGRSSDEVEAARRKLGSIPLIILSQDKAHLARGRRQGVDPDRIYAAWAGGHEDEARDSTRGEHRIVDGAGHWIYGDRPEAVTAAFREVVEAARASGRTAAE